MNNVTAGSLGRISVTKPWQPGFRIMELPSYGGGTLACCISIPSHIDSSAPPLVAIHGIFRDAFAQAEKFAPAAASKGRVVIAPLFDVAQFKGYQQVVTGSRADIALIDLLERIARTGLTCVRRFDLFGYSGGAQFAHRFAMLYPQRVNRVTVAAAGWYTFPDNAPFPIGLGPSKRARLALDSFAINALPRFLRLPIRVFAGHLDNQTDENTRHTPELDARQGTNRLDRARTWTMALKQAAKCVGIDGDIVLHEVPRCGHKFNDYMRHSRLGEIALTSGGE